MMTSTGPWGVILHAVRRSLILMAALTLGMVAVAPSGAAPDVAQQIATHFSNVRTMTGEFEQFGPRGEQTGGKFYLERPGKIRFDYNGSAGFRVISDGTSVVVENKRMNTADIYPLSKTPLKMLLDNRIDLSSSNVQVRQDEDLITVRLLDKQMFGGSVITMMFDARSYELRQWTITDAQGKETTVMVFNTQQGVTFGPGTFAIDYRRVNELNRRGN